MVYDSKEGLMDRDGRFAFADEEETIVSSYELDYEGIEEGKRYLVIPEGIRKISETVFRAYNDSDTILALQNKLVNPGKAREEWLKRLRSNRVIKITFPQEVGKSYFEKAEYMRQKELRVRFLRMSLPTTYDEYTSDTLPDLLERIVVAEDNPLFKAVDGVLFSKDGKSLLRYPGFRDADTGYTVPEETEVIKTGAFKNCVLTSLVLGHNVTLEEGVFENCIIDELVLPDKMTVIKSDSFVNCDIRKITMPSCLKVIEDCAFRGTAGISEIVTSGEEPEMGRSIFEKGYFRDVKWWPYKTIPEACFLNAEIKHLNIPDGVEVIKDYAFAGCYTAKDVSLPDSVKEIGPYSFDLGDTVSADVKVPRHLLKYAYRFPALSKVNKMSKHKAWQNRDDEDFTELPEVLIKQQKDMMKYAGSVSFLQTIQSTMYKQEVQFIARTFGLPYEEQPAIEENNEGDDE